MITGHLSQEVLMSFKPVIFFSFTGKFLAGFCVVAMVVVFPFKDMK